MAYDQNLEERIQKLIIDETDVTEKKMFGGVGFLVNGNMACGVHGDALIARVGEKAHAECMAIPHVREFDMTGHPMTGWVEVAPAGVTSENDLQFWVCKGLTFARTLPPK